MNHSNVWDSRQTHHNKAIKSFKPLSLRPPPYIRSTTRPGWVTWPQDACYIVSVWVMLCVSGISLHSHTLPNSHQRELWWKRLMSSVIESSLLCLVCADLKPLEEQIILSRRAHKSSVPSYKLPVIQASFLSALLLCWCWSKNKLAWRSCRSSVETIPSAGISRWKKLNKSDNPPEWKRVSMAWYGAWQVSE